MNKFSSNLKKNVSKIYLVISFLIYAFEIGSRLTASGLWVISVFFFLNSYSSFVLFTDGLVVLVDVTSSKRRKETNTHW